MCSLRSALIAIVGLSASVPWLAVLVWPGQAPGQTTAASSTSRPASKQLADAAQIERLIRQLGSAQFAEREAASKALETLGEPALPALRKAQQAPDLEVRRRVAALLKSLARKRAPARAKAGAIIKKLGGDVQSEDGTPDGLTGCVDFHCQPVGDVEAALLPCLDDARGINLMAARITDDDLAYIETFYRLQVLDLGGTKVTDAGLKHIEGLVTLICLDLGNTPVTDAGLVHLKKLHQLGHLDLGWTQVTDQGIEQMKEIKTLTWLNLSRTRVTDTGLAKLKKLKGLEWLNLEETRVTDAGLAHLKEIRTLTWLNLNGTKVTERGKAGWLEEAIKREKRPGPNQGRGAR